VESYTPELISPEEFAKRWGVSRSTIFNWRKRGRLKAGRHYIKIGRTVKFVWGPELIAKLHEDCLRDDEQARNEQKAKSNKPRSRNVGQALINLDY
jgi:Helix-turn-helix domain